MIKKTLILFLLSLCLFANNTKNKIDLESSNIKVLDENILQNKTKKDYEEESNLLKPAQEQKTITVKKDDDITIDSDVDFDKSTKSIDGVKLNLGTKF